MDHHIQVGGRNGRVAARISRCSDPDGGDPTGICAHNPSFSANGKRIAFDRGRRLALAAPDGTRLATLPKLTVADSDPAFSPDGTMLVFTGLAGGKRNLYVVAVDGTGLSQLTRAGGRSAAWSSTGQIAYCAGGQVWRLRPGKPGRTRVAKGCHPDWSPSGRAIVYDHRRRIYRAATRKGAGRKLVRAHAQRPAFSPDGKLVAFQDDAGSSYTSIYTVDARTGRGRKPIRRGGELDVGSVFHYFTSVAWQSRP